MIFFKNKNEIILTNLSQKNFEGYFTTGNFHYRFASPYQTPHCTFKFEENLRLRNGAE